MNAFVAALVNHPRVIAIVACTVLLLLGALALVRIGEQRATSKMQTASAIVARSADSAIALATGKLLTVKRENDSLRTRADSMNRIVVEKHTAANLVKSRLVLHGDTALVKTDTGVVSVAIPELLTRQIAAMQMSYDSLAAAQDRRHEADSALVVGLTAQVQIDSTVQAQYRKQLAGVEAQLAADQAAPKHSRVVWFFGGAVTTLAGVVTLAVVF